MTEGMYKHEHKTPIPGWMIAAIVIVFVIAGAINFLSPMLAGEKDGVSADVDGTGAIGRSSGQSLDTVNPFDVKADGILYTEESTILRTPQLSKPIIIGVLVVNVDKCKGLDFEFEGRKFTDVTATPNEYGGIDITGCVEVTSKYSTAVDWSFYLLLEDREIVGASMMHSINPFGEEDGEFNAPTYIDNINYDIDDVKFVAITLRRVDERLEEGYG